MKKTLLFLTILCAMVACKTPKQDPNRSNSQVENSDTSFVASTQTENLARFLTKGHVIFDTIYGDLNKDSIDDCVLITKGTDPNCIERDEVLDTLLDRNRRGIIVLFNKDNHYELIAKNDSCFSSENEDGGVYFAPELCTEIENNNLYIKYFHGRYGNWGYTFRHQNSDFELIGYDCSESNGPVTNRIVSINYLSKKKQIKENTNENANTDGEEVFEEKWSSIKQDKLIKLTGIQDFDELYLALEE